MYFLSKTLYTWLHCTVTLFLFINIIRNKFDKPITNISFLVLLFTFTDLNTIFSLSSKVMKSISVLCCHPKISLSFFISFSLLSISTFLLLMSLILASKLPLSSEKQETKSTHTILHLFKAPDIIQ